MTATSSSWRRALAWLVLLAGGQASVLVLTVAGPLVSYHHFRPWLARGASLVPAGFLIAQAVLVTWLGRRLLPEVARALARRLGARGTLAAGALVLFSCTKLSYEHYPLELAATLAVRAVLLANLILFAAAVPERALAPLGRGLDRWLTPPSEGPEPGGPDRFAWGAAAWCTAVAALLALFVYQRHPHVPDEVVYLWHARTLAAGKLWLPVPDVPEAFDIDITLTLGDRWLSPVPIGWPLILAVGARAGAPWLVNPLLTGGCLLLVYALLRELGGRRRARLGVLLLCTSPWFLFLGMSFMTHTWTQFAALFAALGVARSRRAGTAGRALGWALAAGSWTGVVGLVRPLEGVGLALLLGLWAIGWGGRRLRPAAIATLVVVASAVGGLQLVYNRVMTGSARTFPIMEYVDRTYGPGRNSLGFGPEKGLGWPGLDPRPGHDLLDAFLNAHFNTFAIDFELLGWCAGSLLLVYLLLASRRLGPHDGKMLAVIAVIVGLNSLYWFSGGPDFGARYWYLVLIPCLWLTLSGLERVQSWLATSTGEGGRVRATAAVLALSAVALLTTLPWRATDKYPGYRGMRPDLRHLAAQLDWRGAVILVRGERHPDAASALCYNALDPDSDAPLYLWDRDPLVRRRALERYALPANRPVWIVDGPTRTGEGYAVAAGPLDARELLGER